jgi:hypothetical protein
VTTYAASRSDGHGEQRWWSWKCSCGALLAKTYRTPTDAPLDTLLELRHPVRVREAERDSVPAFGMALREIRETRDLARGLQPMKPRHPSLQGVHEAALQRQTGGSARITANDQQMADHSRWMPRLFDTWCSSCGTRNRIDVARRSQ